MEEVYNFIKMADTYFLATVDGDKPKVRPFGSINIFDSKLYIETSKLKEVSKQIEKNPYVELCALYEGKWLRLSGKLVRDESLEAKESMFENNPILKEFYKVDDAKTEVLYFENPTAIIYSFTDEAKKIKF